MSVLLFADNYSTTLASSIGATDTSATLLSVTGLPSISGNQYFKLTLVNSSSTVYEIVNVTAVTGSTVTIVRGQEGTTAQSWAAGTTISNNWTAGSAAAMQQTAQAQAQSANYAADSGTANHVVVTLTPALTSHVIGMPIRVTIANANTGASDFNPGPSAVAITGPDGSALIAGDLVAGAIQTFIYNGVSYDLAVVGATINRPGASPLATNAQAAAGSDSSHTIVPSALSYVLGSYATLSYVNSAVAPLAPISSPNFTGSPTTTTPSNGDNSTRIINSAWWYNMETSTGFMRKLWGTFSISGTSATLITGFGISALTYSSTGVWNFTTTINNSGTGGAYIFVTGDDVISYPQQRVVGAGTYTVHWRTDASSPVNPSGIVEISVF